MTTSELNKGLAWITLLVAVGGTVLAGCGGGKHVARKSTRGGSINVAIVDTPNTEDLARLTPALFTAKSHIRVNDTILDEDTLREVVSSDVSAHRRQFDVVMIGPYEAPQYGKDGYITELTPMASSDRVYELDDIIPSIREALSYRGSLYASPFYGESSFLMYRKDVLRAAGIKMPAHPTWDQVASIARQINRPGMAGICLRGKPGWGELGATFTTVLNTLGGTWWSAKPNGSVDKAMVDQPAFRKALQFYVGLVRDAGEPNAASASYNECLAQYLNGKVAMWYDATVAAGLLEANGSPVKGKNGYAPAPVERTRASGWLWSWALAIPTLGQQKPALEVHRLGDGTAVHRAGRTQDPRRLGSDPARHPPLDLRDSGVQEGRPRIRQTDAQGDRVGADRRSGYQQAPRHPGHPVRRHPPVPGCRQPVHRAVRRGDPR